MAIEIYRGKYATAEDATKKIDVNTIYDGCNSLSTAADRLSSLTNKVIEFKTVCSKEALSVNDSNMEEPSDAFQTNLEKVSKMIDELVVSICKATLGALNDLQTQLNEDAKKRNDAIAKEKKLEAERKAQEKKNRENEKKAREDAKKAEKIAKEKAKKKKGKVEARLAVIGEVVENHPMIFDKAVSATIDSVKEFNYASEFDSILKNRIDQEESIQQMERIVAAGTNKKGGK